MLYLLPLLFITTTFWPEPQEIQWFLFPLGLAALLFKKNEIVWNPWMFSFVVYALWFIYRINPSAEYSPRQFIYISSVTILLIVLGQERLDRKQFWILNIGMLVWNVGYLTCKWVSCEQVFYIYGPFNQENHFQFFNTTACLGSAYILFVRRDFLQEKLRYFAIISLVCSVATILLSGAKNAIAGVIIGGIVAVIRVITRGRSIQLGLAQSVTIGVVVIGSGLLLLPMWLGNIEALKWFGDSLTSRQVIWRATNSLIHGNWLVGVGPGEYGSSIVKYWPSVTESAYPTKYFPLGPHNFLLNVWSEQGFPGMIFWLGTFGYVWGVLFQRWLVQPTLRNVFLFSAFCSILVQFGLIFSTQWHISSMLLAAAIPAWFLLQESRKTQILARKKLVRVIGLIPVSMLLFAYVPYVSWCYSESIMTPIILSKQINGFVDVERISRSLAVHPNSSALYYGARVQLSQGHFPEAWEMTNQLENLSGYRWPVAKLRAEIKYAQGLCEEARPWASFELNIRQPSDVKDILKWARGCGDYRIR